MFRIVFVQKRGGRLNQRWIQKPSSSKTDETFDAAEVKSAASTEFGNITVNDVAVAPPHGQSNGQSSHVSVGCSPVINANSLHGKKYVYQPKSYGTVSGDAAKETTRKETAAQTAALSRLFKKDLLENFNVDNSTYSTAKIRATFYPKFENEKSDQEVRIRMIEMVSKGLATVEVIASLSIFQFGIHIPLSLLFMYKLNLGVGGAIIVVSMSSWFLVKLSISSKPNNQEILSFNPKDQKDSAKQQVLLPNKEQKIRFFTLNEKK
ncbi:unnamed protein product [Lactuca virosa]|uniref:Uncharacterized protein n=1 Tax=Lactuca virosa TaxID=75947 RepID=A0AAU9MH78_9ASTR|nr:unnamed protein product [Lactuca virosa]